MKVVIQIPCLNEEASLPQTVEQLPRTLVGVDQIEFLVIDDGSTDRTIDVAKQLGVHHIVVHERNRGLATAFKTGIEHSLKVGADIIVNTDADNQYCADDIESLVRPILNRQADVVIGERPILEHPEFTFVKKSLQRIGSWVVRQASGLNIPDATSGFRAFSANAARGLNILTDFSYTLETLIQCGSKSLKVVSVPVRVNPKTRESRLFRGNIQFMYRSARTIIRMFLVYRSSQFFTLLGAVPIVGSIVLALRYSKSVFWRKTNQTAFWPSILLSGFLLMLGFQLFLTGIIAELIGSLRQLTEEILYRERRQSRDLGRD